MSFPRRLPAGELLAVFEFSLDGSLARLTSSARTSIYAVGPLGGGLPAEHKRGSAGGFSIQLKAESTASP